MNTYKLDKKRLLKMMENMIPDDAFCKVSFTIGSDIRFEELVSEDVSLRVPGYQNAQFTIGYFYDSSSVISYDPNDEEFPLRYKKKE